MGKFGEKQGKFWENLVEAGSFFFFFAFFFTLLLTRGTSKIIFSTMGTPKMNNYIIDYGSEQFYFQ